jgi:hypothetical protein
MTGISPSCPERTLQKTPLHHHRTPHLDLLFQLVIFPPKTSGKLFPRQQARRTYRSCPSTLIRLITFRVRIHEHGLARVDLGETEVVRWDEIELIHWLPGPLHDQRMPPRTLLIECSDGRILTFDARIFGLPRLRDRVEKMTLPALLNRSLATLQEGEPISSGPLRIAPQGIHYGLVRIPLSACQAVELGEELLTFRAAEDHSLEVPRTELINAHVLSALIPHLAELSSR